MEHKIIVEIDGVRHKFIENNRPYECEICSLEIFCEAAHQEPCLAVTSKYGHFELEK